MNIAPNHPDIIAPEHRPAPRCEGCGGRGEWRWVRGEQELVLCQRQSDSGRDKLEAEGWDAEPVC